MQAEIKNVNVILTKRSVEMLIKRFMSEDYSLFWRHDEPIVYLMIEKGGQLHELPFRKNRDIMVLVGENIVIKDEKIIKEIEALIVLLQGDAKIKKEKNGKEIEITYNMGLSSDKRKKDNKVKVKKPEKKNKEIENFIRKQEIDFALRLLSKAQKEKNVSGIEEIKNHLKELTSKRA